MNKNVRDAVCAVVLLACALGYVWVIKEFSLFEGQRSANIASWAQAFGSIGAILGAFAVVNHQHKLTAKRDDDLRTAKEAQDFANLIRAVETELNQHHARLLNISRTFEDAPKGTFKKQAFPITMYRTPVFDACASFIGTIDHDDLRTKIIYVYTALGPFYEVLNRNSELLRNFDTLHKEELRELSAIETQIQEDAKYIASNIEEVFNISCHKILLSGEN